MFNDSFSVYLLIGLVFALSAGVSVLIVLTQHHHGKLTHDSQHGVQKFHVSPTPRVGGVAMVVALITGWLLLENGVRQLFGLMLLAGIPAFGAGFIEDLTNKVSVGKRLLATMLSGLIASLLMGYSLTSVNIPGLDLLLSVFPVVSVAFTAFAVSGVANAVNIIDGFNGLASGVMIIGFSIFCILAYMVGDAELAMICMLQIAVLAGFLIVNYPFGKLFMGDGGAYFMGFMLAWTAVMLHVRNPQVSVWAPLLVCAYPITETLFSIVRRYRKRLSPGGADSEHLHSLIKVKIVRRYFFQLPSYQKNSLVAPFCWLLALLYAIPALYFYQDTQKLVLVFIGSTLVYGALYSWIAQMDDAEVPLTGKACAERRMSTEAQIESKISYKKSA